MLEEEDNFFATIPDHRVIKNIVRPAMLNINHNGKYISHLGIVIITLILTITETYPSLLLYLIFCEFILSFSLSAMIKKLLESVPGNNKGISTSQPQFVGEVDSSTSQQIPAKIEDIPVLKQVANNRPGGNWHSDQNGVRIY